MISLDKCNGSCNNYVDDISANARVPSKTKGINVKVVNMITRINEAKTLMKYLSCECKSNRYSFNTFLEKSNAFLEKCSYQLVKN